MEIASTRLPEYYGERCPEGMARLLDQVESTYMCGGCACMIFALLKFHRFSYEFFMCFYGVCKSMWRSIVAAGAVQGNKLTYSAAHSPYSVDRVERKRNLMSLFNSAVSFLIFEYSVATALEACSTSVQFVRWVVADSSQFFFQK